MNPPANAGDAGDKGLIPGLGRSPGVGNGNLLQYSGLENSMDRGALKATIHWGANYIIRRKKSIHENLLGIIHFFHVFLAVVHSKPFILFYKEKY